MTFHFHDRFSDTMAIVTRLVTELAGDTESRRTVRILDIPAGAGRLTAALQERGFSVTAADINRAHDAFVFADMTKRLPFENESFDVVISMEGIEHIPNTVEFIGELSRITGHGGIVILTSPNICCMYSRIVFLFTGFFFQFRPEQGSLNIRKEAVFDCAHISPVAWNKILLHFVENGFDLVGIYGNRVKRKILFPLYLLILAFGSVWSMFAFRKYRKCIQPLPEGIDFYAHIRKHAQSFPVLFSRNIILVMRKREANTLSAD